MGTFVTSRRCSSDPAITPWDFDERSVEPCLSPAEIPAPVGPSLTSSDGVMGRWEGSELASRIQGSGREWPADRTHSGRILGPLIAARAKATGRIAR